MSNDERDDLKQIIYQSNRLNTQVDLQDQRRLQGSQLAWAGFAADAITAAGYRKPPVIDADKLSIHNGLLLLEVSYCTCGSGNPEHEPMCGFELLEDLTNVLAKAGYRKEEPSPYDPLWRLYGKDRGWM